MRVGLLAIFPKAVITLFEIDITFYYMNINTQNDGIRLKVNGLIGLSGLATSGKDLLYYLLSLRGVTDRMDLADNLKKDVRGFIIDKLGIDINDCNAGQKELIRPLLVSYGKVRRVESGGSYWTKKIESSVISKKDESLVVITDIRYCDSSYINDEVFWLKSMGGVLIHIKRYTVENGVKKYVLPPNADEQKFDPIIESMADFHIEWPTCKDKIDMLNPYVDTVVTYLNGKLSTRNR